MKTHWRMLEFSLVCLWRQKARNGMTLAVYTTVVFFLASVLFMAGALKHEASLLLSRGPELTVQKLSAGRHEWVPLSHAESIKTIPGVKAVTPRYWGYYYDPPPGATYTVVGQDKVPLTGTRLLENQGYGNNVPWACVIGHGVAEARLLQTDDILPAKGSNGQLRALRVTDTFSATSSLLTHDLILLRVEEWRQFFCVPPGVATDLAVEVPNASEVQIVTRKILERLPDVRVIGRESMLKTYEAVFNWRGSMVLLAFAGALATFVIFAWDRASGLGAEESRNLGVLKAVGWTVSDVLKLKMWEGAGLSLVAFMTGALAAHLHVFHFGGRLLIPWLKGWSALFPEFHLRPNGELFQLFTVLMLTVVPYVLGTLAPAWTAATTDPDRMMRQ